MGHKINNSGIVKYLKTGEKTLRNGQSKAVQNGENDNEKKRKEVENHRQTKTAKKYRIV